MFHCHPCIFPCVFLSLWSQEKVRTWRKDEFRSNFTRFGSRNGILTKFIDDSAWFLLEKLKNHVILSKNLNIWSKNQKIFEKIRKILKNQWIPRVPRWRPMWSPIGRHQAARCCSVMYRWKPPGRLGLSWGRHFFMFMWFEIWTGRQVVTEHV